MSAEVLVLPTGYTGPEEREWERPVSRATIAALLGVSTRTVDRWVARGLPETSCWIRIGSHRRFYPSRVRAWLSG